MVTPDGRSTGNGPSGPLLGAVTTVAEYDGLMRRRATDQGDLIIRSGFAAPMECPEQLVFTLADGTVGCCDLPGRSGDGIEPGPVQPARRVIELLERMVPVPSTGEATRPVPVLFADDQTVRKVIAGLRATAGRRAADRRRYLSAANRLALVSTMKFSVLRPVLTRLLSHRFWLPARYSPGRWQDWATAWSQTAKIARSAGRVELLQALTTLAFTGGGSLPMPRTISSSLVGGEASAWRRGASSRAAFTHSAYRSVIGFEAAWVEANLADPCLHDRNMLSGEIAAGVVTQTTGKIKISLSNTPRFNDVNLWAVINGQRYKATREEMLVGDDNQLTMVLTVPPRWARVFSRARTDQSTVSVYPQRFTMPAAIPDDSNRWLTASEQTWKPRSVPADVILAGAPSGA